MKLIHGELSERILGCAIRVHQQLGPGFLEKIYEEALCLELESSLLAFERQRIVHVHHAGQPIGEHRLDLLVEGMFILELKACAGIEDIHLATTRSYLKATGLQPALILNFTRPTLDNQRVVLTQ